MTADSLLLAAILLGSPPTERTEDRWIADDKIRHLSMSYALVAGVSGAARAAGLGKDVSLATGITAAAIAGLGKEVYDFLRGGRFSARDLVWDAAGLLVGVIVVRAAN